MARRGNLGATPLVKRRASRNPMDEFDALPPELRGWLSRAALPWSPRSSLKIWRRARKEGAAPDAILARLSEVETRQLERLGAPANRIGSDLAAT